MDWEAEKDIIKGLVRDNNLSQATNDRECIGKTESMPCNMCTCMPSW